MTPKDHSMQLPKAINNKKERSQHASRRQFVKTTGVAASALVAAPYVVPANVLVARDAIDAVTIGTPKSQLTRCVQVSMSTVKNHFL